MSQADAGTSATGLSLRDVIFLAIFFVAWAPSPMFADLGSTDIIVTEDGRAASTYITFAVLAVAAGALVFQTNIPALKALLIPSNIALTIWIGVSCVTSQDPAVSIKRAALVVFVVLSCLSLFLLPRTRSDFDRLLSIVAQSIVALCYFGVIFLPYYSMHQATDLGEAHLAGDWRGYFIHKNHAAAVFSVLSFIGLYLARTERRGEGWAIFILSIVFVLFSGGKSSTGICFATIALSLALAQTRNIALWWLIAFAPLILLNLVGVGSVIFPEVGALASSFQIDTSFTGRKDIWAFVVPKAAERLPFGYGFVTFWQTDSLKYGMEQNNLWAGTAAHAHNGYLDSVLSMGLPGLLLTIWALAIQPARDMKRAFDRAEDPQIAMLFLQIWMFSLYLSSLESFLYDRAAPSWIALLFAIFGARFLANFRLSK